MTTIAAIAREAALNEAWIAFLADVPMSWLPEVAS